MNPILVKTDFIELPAYRIFLVLGAVCFFAGLWHLRRPVGFKKSEHFWLAVNLLALSAFLGARLMFLVLQSPTAAANWPRAIASLHSGFTVFGFFPGIFAGAVLCAKILKLHRARLLDGVSLFLPAWLALARVGCFLNGCCCGRPMQHPWPWAVTFTDPRSAVPRELLGVPLHPAQLYEAAGNLVLLACLYAVWRGVRRGRFPEGLVCSSFLAGYGLLRFTLEWFRADTQPFSRFLTVAQALALMLIALGIFFGLVCRRKSAFQPNQIDPAVQLKIP